MSESINSNIKAESEQRNDAEYSLDTVWIKYSLDKIELATN